MSNNPTDYETVPIIQPVDTQCNAVQTGGPTSSRLTEEIIEFDRIRIPSLELEIYTDPYTSSLISIPKTTDIYQLNLKSDVPVLPPRLQGEIPTLSEHGLLEQHRALQSLIQRRKQRVKSFLQVPKSA